MEKEMATYKDRMKLAHKEAICHYAREEWPIIYDRYQTLRLLGQGGVGAVYKCYDLDTFENVAIKRIEFKLGDGEDREDNMRRLER